MFYGISSACKASNSRPIDPIVIESPARLASLTEPGQGLGVQNLWTFFCRMHNLSDTPGVGNLPASPEPEMEGGPLPQNLGFKTAAMQRCAVCVRIILLMEASGAFS